MKNKKLLIFLGMLVLLNLTSLPDKIALNYIDDALTSSALAYVAARGLNATISVIQDIEISAGIASVSPGELLDPLNDLIERFSTVMLFATASLGVQKIMLSISGWLLLQLIIAVLIVLLIANLYFRDKLIFISNQSIGIIYKALIFLLALRFSVPFMSIANGVIEDIFIKDKINTHISELQKIDKSTKELSKLKAKIEITSNKIDGQTSRQKVSEDGFLDYLKNTTDAMISSVSKTADELNPNKKARAIIEQISHQSSEVISSATTLISLFVVQSILLPLLFLYVVLFSARGLYQYKIR